MVESPYGNRNRSPVRLWQVRTNGNAGYTPYRRCINNRTVLQHAQQENEPYGVTKGCTADSPNFIQDREKDKYWNCATAENWASTQGGREWVDNAKNCTVDVEV